MLAACPRIDPNAGDGLGPPIVTAMSSVFRLLAANDKTDVNAETPLGFTVLLEAVHIGRTELVEILLRRPDLDINRQAGRLREKITALHLAVMKRSPTVHLLLKEETIDLTIKNARNQTPIDVARIFGVDGLAETMESLAAKKANSIID